jgi:hypothetical protein
MGGDPIALCNAAVAAGGITSSRLALIIRHRAGSIRLANVTARPA